MATVKNLITIYKPGKTDWMMYHVSKNNPFTYHHIIKRSDGGDRSISNGAILTEAAQIYLHSLEDEYYYVFLNELLKEINILGFQEYQSGIKVQRRVIKDDKILVLGKR